MSAQPKALYLLNFVSMWECFSYYGMRALLVLFMTEEMGFTDSRALYVYALYTTLIELGGVIGGILADKVFGLRISLILGGWTLVLGHFCLAFLDTELCFYLGLAIVIIGTSFFRTNAAAYLGTFYEDEDSRRERGYTLYYAGINVGGLLATLLCGGIAETFGWHAGFSLAAFGMLIGNISLLLGKKCFPNTRKEKIDMKIFALSTVSVGVLSLSIAFALSHAENTISFLPLAFLGALFFILQKARSCSFEEKRVFFCLSGYVFLLVLFYSVEELLGSTLVLFAERLVDRNTPLGVFPAESLSLFNPLTVLVAGFFLPSLFKTGGVRKIGVGFSFLVGSFVLLFFASIKEVVPLETAISSVILISLGEVLIGPTVYAMGAKSAPKRLIGFTMSFVSLGFAFANLLSGYLSQFMAVESGENASKIYHEGFGMIALVFACVPFLLLILQPYKKRIFGYDQNRI